VQGTEGNDRIRITNAGGSLRVQITGPKVDYDHYFDTTNQTISRIDVYSQGGNDTSPWPRT
jgi:hypothetical protein